VKPAVIAAIVIPIAGIGGYFAASKGMINVPGITPKKVVKKDPAKDAAAKVEPTKKPKVKIQETPKQDPKKPEAPKEDPAKGVEMVADVWSNLKPDQLAPIAARYNDKDLVPILLILDSKKTAQLLALMKPDRAEKLSREIQKQASIIESPS
jgi:hypothetical protein